MIKPALRALATLGLLALAACSPESVAPPGKLRIQLASAGKTAASRTSLAQAFDALSTGHLKPVIRTLAALPISTSDFECFAVNITAEDIQTAIGLTSSSCKSTSNIRAKGFGILTKAFRKGEYVDVDVPEGFGRNIDVYGLFPTPADCGGTETAISAYILGSVTRDLTADTTVTVPINYSGGLSDFSCNTPPVITAPLASVGTDFACGLDRYGEIYCWGTNTTGQLAVNSAVQQDTPVQALNPAGTAPLGGAVSLAAGAGHVCAATASQTALCWGGNVNGQLGNGSTTQSGLPVAVSGVGGVGLLANVSDVAVSSQSSCALTTTNNVYCWGLNTSGQVGDATTTSRATPVKVTGVGGVGFLSNIFVIAAGGSHACAVDTTLAPYCWGLNSSGELGDTTTTNRSSPVAVTGLASAVDIAAGGAHSCAIDGSGGVWCWGLNSSGQLGDGTVVNRTSAVQVKGVGGVGFLSNVVWIATGASHTCAVDASRNAYCWGLNSSGQLGDGTTTNRLTPVQVLDANGTAALALIDTITAGSAQTCAVDIFAQVLCWGGGTLGALGDNLATSSSVPVYVQGVSGIGVIEL